MKADEIEIPIQINGKRRSRIMARREISREALEAALAKAKIQGYSGSKQILKIVVPNRLVSIVVEKSSRFKV